MIRRRRLMQAGAAAAALPRVALAQSKPEKLVFVGDNGPWHCAWPRRSRPHFRKNTA